MSHPAADLVAAGQTADAIRYLEAKGDHPAGLALLKAGFDLYAHWVLTDVAPIPPAQEPAA